MRRILMILALLVLGGCATTQYRYVDADGGYYTSGADGHPYASSAAYGGWGVSTYGRYGYGSGYWSPFWSGYGGGFAGGWGYMPYYGAFWPYAVYSPPRHYRDRHDLDRDKVLQGRGDAMRVPRAPVGQAGIRREFSRPYALPVRPSAPMTRPGIDVQRVVPRGSPRATPMPSSRPYNAPSRRQAPVTRSVQRSVPMSAPRNFAPAPRSSAPATRSSTPATRGTPRGQPPKH